MKNRFNMINRNWKYMINSGCTVIRFNMIKSKLVLYDLLLWVFWWIKMYDSETVSEILWKNSAGPPPGGRPLLGPPRRSARWSCPLYVIYCFL